MTAYMPFIVIGLALVAAISIGVLAWELTDETLHEELEKGSRPRDENRE